ncbi:hypothetical protein E4U53_004188, partial [Claviceps sorghi]
RYTMIGVFPVLYFGYKVVRKTKIYKPEEVDLFKDLHAIAEYERDYVPQPAKYDPAQSLWNPALSLLDFPTPARDITVGYFLVRIYHVLIKIDVDRQDPLREYIDDEMGHYARDCWDAELLTSVNSRAIGTPLAVKEPCTEPIEVEDSSPFAVALLACVSSATRTRTRTRTHQSQQQQPSKMSGLESPDISTAYADVRSDKKATNWMLISYAAPTGNKLALSKTGTGGISELAAALDDAEVQYGYVRVEYANDKESTRVKFVLVVWIGERTKVMRKARVSVESGDVKRILAHHSIAVTATDRAELQEQDIVARLRKAGGADYNGGRG